MVREGEACSDGYAATKISVKTNRCGPLRCSHFNIHDGTAGKRKQDSSKPKRAEPILCEKNQVNIQ